MSDNGGRGSDGSNGGSGGNSTVPWKVLRMGLVSPLGRNVFEHMCLTEAETSAGYSGQLLTEPIAAGEHEGVMACEWLSPQWRGAARIGALARLAVRDALRGAGVGVQGDDAHWQDGGKAPPVSRSVNVALIVDTSLSELERNGVAAAVCDEIGRCSIDAVMDRRDSCALASLLLRERSEEEKEDAPLSTDMLIVAADSWLGRQRLNARPPRSPWESEPMLPSEGAAALWLRASDAAAGGSNDGSGNGHSGSDGAADVAPWATLTWARQAKGPARAEGIVDGGPLTLLFHRLPLLPASIAAVWGRTAGDVDRQIALSYAAARVAAGAQPFCTEYATDSLAHTAGQLGAAEMTAELVFAIAAGGAIDNDSDSGAGGSRHVLVWGAQDDGMWASCLAAVPERNRWYGRPVAPTMAWPKPKTRQPDVVELHPVTYLDRSEPGVFVQHSLEQLMEDALSRARDRWQLPLREQAAVERRLDRQCLAMLELAPSGIAAWLSEQGHTPAEPELAFVGACLLSRSVARGLVPAPPLLSWLTGSIDDNGASSCAPQLWAGVEGLAYVGLTTAKALKAVERHDGGTVNAAAAAVLLHYGALRAAAHPQRRAALIDGLTRLPLDEGAVSPSLAATFMHVAARLDHNPWLATALHQWLEVWLTEELFIDGQNHVCIEAARALRLHGGPQGDAYLRDKLNDDSFIAHLGPTALELAVLSPALMDGDWLTQLRGALPVSCRTLNAVACAGHARSYAYLLYYLEEGPLQGAAEQALHTLFGAPAQPRSRPEDWTAWIAAQRFSTTQRLRRGRPWSTDVVIEEIASGELSRRQLQHRLDELAVALPVDDIRAAAARVVDVGAPIERLNAQLTAIVPSPYSPSQEHDS